MPKPTPLQYPQKDTKVFGLHQLGFYSTILLRCIQKNQIGLGPSGIQKILRFSNKTFTLYITHAVIHFTISQKRPYSTKVAQEAICLDCKGP